MRCRQPGCGYSFAGQTITDVCPNCDKNPCTDGHEEPDTLQFINTAKAEKRGLMIINGAHRRKKPE